MFLFLVLCGCDPYVYEHPYNYKDSIWVCEEPNITYYVVGSPEDENSYDYAVTKIDGQDITLDFGFRSTVFSAVIHDENNEEAHMECLAGTCRYSKNQFTVTVDKETDQLFNGQYETLVFKRIE